MKSGSIIIVSGNTAVGKTTLNKRLVASSAITRVHPGEILVENNISTRIPDEKFYELIFERLDIGLSQNNTVMLEGFPRDSKSFSALLRLLTHCNSEILLVVEVSAPLLVILKRKFTEDNIKVINTFYRLFHYYAIERPVLYRLKQQYPFQKFVNDGNIAKIYPKYQQLVAKYVALHGSSCVFPPV